MKKMINSNFTEKDEEKFVIKIDFEILKIYSFIDDSEINLINKLQMAREKNAIEGIKNDLFGLTEFIRVNILAIKRILQRHDKFTGFILIDKYKNGLKEKSNQITKISDLLHEHNENDEKQLLSDDCNYFLSKFLIPSENLVKIKLEILNKFTKVETENSVVSTIYLDNSSFSLYSSFVEKKDKSFFIYLRWFGNKNDLIDFELKNNICNQTECKVEVKRLRIPKNLVLSFLNGNDIFNQITEISTKDDHYSGSEHAEEPREDSDNGLTASLRSIYDEMQAKIKKYRLRPTVRTFYRRSIFVSNEYPDFLINLDTNVVMIRECSNVETDSFPLKSWGRSDVGYDWPFRNLSPNEIERFSSSVLTISNEQKVKISINFNEWLEKLLSSSKIEKIECFSKFVHGCSALYPKLKMEKSIKNDITDDLKYLNSKDVVNRSSYDSCTGESDVFYNFSPVIDENKQVIIPVRIEPKVFFANERTFLSWVQFSIFLGGVGTAMIGLGNTHAYLIGVMLIAVAAIFSFYALYLFHFRAARIRIKDPGPYEDLMGPSILTGIFIIVMLLAFIFKFPLKKGGLK
jgi:SPX domain protein involved in polyphosphate accumulation/uncharacterized membrane protein YidH (DUF202 family)